MALYVDSNGQIVNTDVPNAPTFAGSVYNLLQPSTYGVGSFGSYGTGGGLTAPASAAFDTFMSHAFDVISSTGTAQFSQLNSTFNTWAQWQTAFADRVARVFEDVGAKTAKAPGGLISSIFG